MTTKPAIGALISDGGRGAFPADIIAIGDVFVVVGNPDWGGIKYGHPQPTHEVAEFPERVYSNRARGIMVVPKAQLVERK